jgi:hypothetical protein
MSDGVFELMHAPSSSKTQKTTRARGAGLATLINNLELALLLSN